LPDVIFTNKILITNEHIMGNTTRHSDRPTIPNQINSRVDL